MPPYLVLSAVTLLARRQRTMQIDGRRGGHLEAEARHRVVEVDMLNLNLSAFQSQEFIVGIAVAAILVSALVASSMFRNIALALAAGARGAALSAGRRPGADRDLDGGGEGNPGAAGLLQRAGGGAGGFRRAPGRACRSAAPDGPATASNHVRSRSAPAASAGAFFSSASLDDQGWTHAA